MRVVSVPVRTIVPSPSSVPNAPALEFKTVEPLRSVGILHSQVKIKRIRGIASENSMALRERQPRIAEAIPLIRLSRV